MLAQPACNSGLNAPCLAEGELASNAAPNQMKFGPDMQAMFRAGLGSTALHNFRKFDHLSKTKGRVSPELISAIKECKGTRSLVRACRRGDFVEEPIEWTLPSRSQFLPAGRPILLIDASDVDRIKAHVAVSLGGKFPKWLRSTAHVPLQLNVLNAQRGLLELADDTSSLDGIITEENISKVMRKIVPEIIMNNPEAVKLTQKLGLIAAMGSGERQVAAMKELDIAHHGGISTLMRKVLTKERNLADMFGKPEMRMFFQKTSKNSIAELLELPLEKIKKFVKSTKVSTKPKAIGTACAEQSIITQCQVASLNNEQFPAIVVTGSAGQAQNLYSKLRGNETPALERPGWGRSGYEDFRCGDSGGSGWF